MEDYIVSARKYRPMTFDSVVGQRALTTTLKNAVRSGKLAHAYLFCGPRGVGKTTCARIFAKTINCQNPTPEGEACNNCENCRAFNEGRSLNIFELDAASNNSVDNIKQLMEQTRIPPQTGRYKVFIIDEVHMLSPAAFNAFLKTLEEPPAHVIFILATTEKNKILPTILSRCQIYDFERMTVQEIVEHLKMVAQKEGITYDEQSLGVIAEKADGGMRDALSIFDQAASFCQGHISYEKVLEDLNVLDADNYFKIVDYALENKAADIMVLLNGVISHGFDAGNLVGGLASHVRNVLMAKDAATLPLLEASDQQRARYQDQAKRCPTPFLYKALEIMNRCDINYRQSSNKRLLVELTLIEIAQITQPEDKDAPAAGRSPKRLKSLFRNLVAASKPTQQGGGDRRRAPKDSTPAATAAPTADSQSATPQQAPAAQPAAEPQLHKSAAPQRKGGTPTISLQTIGLTFDDLRRGPQKPVYAKEPVIENPEEKELFTDDDLLLQWTAMCNRMPQEMMALAVRMKNVMPHITTYPNIEVVADNDILLREMESIKGRIRATLAKGLHNASINITMRLAEAGEVKRPLSKREIFDGMRRINPAIEKLRERLGLELA